MFATRISIRYAMENNYEHSDKYTLHIFGDCGGFRTKNLKSAVVKVEDEVLLGKMKICSICKKRQNTSTVKNSDTTFEITNADALLRVQKEANAAMSVQDVANFYLLKGMSNYRAISTAAFPDCCLVCCADGKCPFSNYIGMPLAHAVCDKFQRMEHYAELP